MKAYQRETQLRTAGGLSIKDITDEVAEAVRASGIRDGICSVYSPHTTCSVRVNEFESGFLEDFALLLKRLVPSDDGTPAKRGKPRLCRVSSWWARQDSNLGPTDYESAALTS